MDENLLEIREFKDPGYLPIIDFSDWRVAILNYIDEIRPDQIKRLERHNETDEVFVLLSGQGILFIGEGSTGVDAVLPQILESGIIYNVKMGVWHAIVLSHDGSVLIVENRNTASDNSEYSYLSPEQCDFIIRTSRNAIPDWR